MSDIDVFHSQSELARNGIIIIGEIPAVMAMKLETLDKVPKYPKLGPLKTIRPNLLHLAGNTSNKMRHMALLKFHRHVAKVGAEKSNVAIIDSGTSHNFFHHRASFTYYQSI